MSNVLPQQQKKMPLGIQSIIMANKMLQVPRLAGNRKLPILNEQVFIAVFHYD